MERKKEADLCRIDWCDRPIVRVLGTVMTRDDTLGGWVPYLNGGQSKVGIHESVDGRRYRIYGWRVNDKKVTLDCFIQRHMVFHETIGTFHHWKIGDSKMGLTFYTPAEARSFNRGVRVALEKLARVAEYTNSSASSTCSRLSDDHQSSCTSSASSTGSSSPCEKSNCTRTSRTSCESKKKLSTSSNSSSSSRHGNRKHSPSVKQGRSRRATHNSTSSNTSTQNRAIHTHHIPSVPAVAATPALSLLSFCDTPSPVDLGQPHFRYPLPQQQPYKPNLTFLNRIIAKDSSHFELSALSHSSPQTPSNTMCKEPEVPTMPPKLVHRFGNEECDPVDDQSKNNEKAISSIHSPPSLNNQPHQHESSRSRNRRVPSNEGRQRAHHYGRPRHTKTPYLDNANRLRDLKPTEPNSYVLFSSSKPATSHSSQHITGRSLTTIGASLPGIRPEYKALGQMTLVDGFQYHPILSPATTSPQFQHPQTGALSIMASTMDEAPFYNRTDMYFTSNIDSIKDDAIIYEPGSSLISSPNKSKIKDCYYDESMSDFQPHSSCSLCCCPGIKLRPRRRSSSSHNRINEDLAERSRCTRCREMFNHESNKPGSCKYAPDKCLENINKVTCMCCVSSLFYHCCRDDEGDYDEQPCTCTSRERGRSKTLRRWSALAALSVIFPCLCLYPPLRACHSCGVAFHCCGGKHQASYSSTKSTDKQPKR
uniref:uncharacterized protein LOC120336778 isoform X1 n=1 Tax=Styela clava TaxID=7725 RepID=UPI00193A178D|nr:uncharacterized protein LOC120336778 isoform X1 [Styela clava]